MDRHISLWLVLVSQIVFATCKGDYKKSEASSVIVQVNTSHIVHTVDPRFYSFGLGCTKVDKRVHHFILNSSRLNVLAKALSPSVLRLGGSECSCLTFESSGQENLQKTFVPVHMNGEGWVRLNDFVRDAGWDLLFDLNALLRQGDEWNSTNAELLLDFNEQKGFRVMWELGNEPSHYLSKFNVSISPEQIAKDLVKFRSILNNRTFYKDATFVGPDITYLSFRKNPELLGRILQNVGSAIDATTWHIYPIRGVPLIQFLLSPQELDFLEEAIKEVKKTVETSRSPSMQEIWLGETGTMPGGRSYGCPQDTFTFSLFMLDKLGLSAKAGLSLIIRETLIDSGPRSIVSSNYNPRIDYWQALVHKRVVGQKVLHVTKSLSVRENNATLDKLRLYAHCTRIDSVYKYPPGAVTILAVNVDFKSDYSLNLGTGAVYVFLFTPGDDLGVQSRNVALNGKLLEMGDDNILPELNPKHLSSGESVILPSLTYAFYVLPEARAKVCLQPGRK